MKKVVRGYNRQFWRGAAATLATTYIGSADGGTSDNTAFRVALAPTTQD